jgi:DNA mismatch repair protein MSH3
MQGLCRIAYGRATPYELLRVLNAFSRIANEFPAVADASDVGFESGLLNEAIVALPEIRQRVETLLSQYNTEKAKDAEVRKEDLFQDPDQFPEIDNSKACLAAVEYELEEELKSARTVLSKPSLVFVVSIA